MQLNSRTMRILALAGVHEHCATCKDGTQDVDLKDQFPALPSSVYVCQECARELRGERVMSERTREVHRARHELKRDDPGLYLQLVADERREYGKMWRRRG